MEISNEKMTRTWLITFIYLFILGFTGSGWTKSLPPNCQKTTQYFKQSHFGPPLYFESDYLLLDKSRRLLHLFSGETLIETFRVALGSHPKGAKIKEGDGKTPEGSYFIDSRNSASRFHLSLHISYPNSDDLDEARRRDVDPGGSIMIHGLPNEDWKKPFIRHPKDWTKGCVAVQDPEIEMLWEMVSTGTPIDLCP